MSKNGQVLPRDALHFHERQAAHLRALADRVTTRRIKQRLLDQAAERERAAQLDDEMIMSEPKRGNS